MPKSKTKQVKETPESPKVEEPKVEVCSDCNGEGLNAEQTARCGKCGGTGK